MRSTKFPSFFTKLSWTAAVCLVSPSLLAIPLVVTTAGDTSPGTAGAPGDLRTTLNFINQNPGNYEVTFNSIAPTINLAAMLPILNLNAANTVTIDGANGGSPIVIDGGGTQRGFFARLGTVTLSNLAIQNVDATGGNGASGGGGGMGAGAGLFVDQANVTLSNVSISSAVATGGNGSIGAGNGGGGGGLVVMEPSVQVQEAQAEAG